MGGSSEGSSNNQKSDLQGNVKKQTPFHLDRVENWASTHKDGKDKMQVLGKVEPGVVKVKR